MQHTKKFADVVVTALHMLSRMNKDKKRSTIDARLQAEPLAAGSSDDCTNVSDSMPKDITLDHNSNESGSNQILAVRNMAAVTPMIVKVLWAG